MDKNKKQHWEEAILNLKERLQDYEMWFPYPCLLSFFLALLFIGHLLLGINPRLGNPAETLKFDGEKSYEGAIWLSITSKNSQVTVTTSDRKIFNIDNSKTDPKKLDPLYKYLQDKTHSVALSSALANDITHTQSIVVLAVDKRTTFGQIRPILYTLARAGISEYGYETLKPNSKI